MVLAYRGAGPRAGAGEIAPIGEHTITAAADAVAEAITLSSGG